MINLLIDDNKLDKFIIRLIIFVNNHYKYDNNYIKKNYNANSHKEFVKLFKKNYKKKILFSSFESEQLFINFLNIDFNFLLEKYQELYPIKILNFFISRKKFYFNYCHYSNNNKHTHNYKHVKDICCCNIKVKSIVNLPIESLIFILKQNYHKNKSINDISTSSQLLSSHILIENKLNSSLSISNDTNKQINKSNNDIKLKQPKIIRVAKNNDTKDLIKCLYNLEKANDKLGLDIIDNHYTIDSESINNYENNIDNYIKNEKNEKNKNIKNIKKNNYNIISKFDVEESHSSEILNHNIKLKTTNIEHTNQFSSESINVFNEKIKQKHNEINNVIDIKYKFESESNSKSSKSSGESNSKSSGESNSKSSGESNSKSSGESNSKSSGESNSKSSDETNSKSSDETNSKSSDETNSKSSDETNSKSSDETNSKSNDELEYTNNFNQLSKKDKIKKCVEMMIKKLQTNNNILFKDNNVNKICIGLKKIIKEEYPIDMASKFDRLYQKTILTNKISDTDDMEKYGNLIIQLNEFKNLL
jgi:hypothetical protein